MSLELNNKTINNHFLIHAVDFGVEELDLSECILHGDFIDSFPSITRLRMNNVYSIPSGFFSNFPNLKELSLMESVVDLFDSKMNTCNLEKLSLCAAEVKNAVLLLTQKKLYYLDVCSCNSIGMSRSNFVITISMINSLKYLDIRIDVPESKVSCLFSMLNLEIVLFRHFSLTRETKKCIQAKDKLVVLTEELTIMNATLNSIKQLSSSDPIWEKIFFCNDSPRVKNAYLNETFNAF